MLLIPPASRTQHPARTVFAGRAAPRVPAASHPTPPSRAGWVPCRRRPCGRENRRDAAMEHKHRLGSARKRVRSQRCRAADASWPRMHPCATFYRRLRRRGLCLWNLFSFRLARAPLARAYVSSIGTSLFIPLRQRPYALRSVTHRSQLTPVAPFRRAPPERGHLDRIVGHVLDPLVIVIVAEHPLEPTAALDEPHAPDRR